MAFIIFIIAFLLPTVGIIGSFWILGILGGVTWGGEGIDISLWDTFFMYKTDIPGKNKQILI